MSVSTIPPPPVPGAEETRSSLEQRGVRCALASFVDLQGGCKAKAGPIDHLDAMLASSELFTGAALHGVPQDVSDAEGLIARFMSKPFADHTGSSTHLNVSLADLKMGRQCIAGTGSRVDCRPADPLPRQVFGDAMADASSSFKRHNWQSHHAAISTWERERYLEPF